jgi:signal transduction histidine kinase
VAKPTKHKAFKLTRWFAILGLLVTGLVSVLSSLLLSKFLVSNILHKDATVSMEFVQSIAQVQQAKGYFTGERAADKNLEEFFNHIATMPDVIRANVFSLDRKIIWSSDATLIGRTFPDNPELEAALQGEIQTTVENDRWKPEHIFLAERRQAFVENYLPVRSRGEVIGVVEVYKSPRTLFASLDDGLRLIWLCGIGGGAFLYAVMFWLVRRADRTIQAQQARLVESETLAALGAMASAVAHGIRNPLASIRSSAELHLESSTGAARDASEDIVTEVDRLERWIRDLLTYSVPEAGEPENVQISEVLHDSLNDFAGIFRKRAIQVSWNDSHPAVSVRGDHALLTQVFNCLLTNAMEAMPEGGRIELTTGLASGADKVRVSVSDTGVGVPAEALADVFVPLKSTKRTGLGVGLPLAKRIVEHFGGDIGLVSGAGRGATVHVDLVVAR